MAASNEEQFREDVATLEVDASAYMEELNEAADGHIGPEFRAREPME